MTDYQDMSGIWRGEFRYEDATDDSSVNFTVWFRDLESGLSGNSLETNTFAPGAANELSAVFYGDRNGLSFSLSKTYTCELGFHDGSISYEGDVSLDFATAHGTWSYPEYPQPRGTFQLTRLSQKQFVKAERHAGVNIGLRR